ncbi:MAG: LTA synthase family protein [Lachnospiraceae bacterium]|nr:LTA synthase family protein [Lachnospiraceae bacterium]
MNSIKRIFLQGKELHKGRLAAGIVLFVGILLYLFGTDVLREERVNYHTGEGAQVQVLSDQNAEWRQTFVPAFRQLQSLSLLLDLETVSQTDGEVHIVVSDQVDTILFQKALSFAELADGRFTDVEVNLSLYTDEIYYIDLFFIPSSAQEYPELYVCDKAYYLPENQKLLFFDDGTSYDTGDLQLVSRYVYTDVLPVRKAVKVLFLVLLLAVGVVYGLPQNRWIRIAAVAALFLAGPYVLGRRLELLTYNEMYYLPMAMRWNVGIMYVIELLLLLLTHSPRFSVVLMNVGMTLLYSANYFVNIFRGAPLRTGDFTAIGTAVKVAGNYDFQPNDHLAFVWLLCTILVVFAVQTKHPSSDTGAKEDQTKKRTVRKIAFYLATGVLAIALGRGALYLLIDTDLLRQAGFSDEKELKGINSNLIYAFDGYLIGSCIDYRSTRIEPPQGYSAGRVKEILQPYETEQMLSDAEKEQLPHVILIMNESLADLRVYGELELNQEYLPFLNALSENTIRGYTNVSVFGGGTANSEFEVLTGCSTALLPTGYYPYQQGINAAKNSMVSQFEKYGYTTWAMHPAPKTNWSRGKVYGLLGFDQTLWKQDFEGAERIHSGVSDQATYDKIISLYEARQAGERMFVFDVTIQNHGGYNRHEVPYAIQAQNVVSPALDEYLSAAYKSDQAFENLLAYFEKQEDKVVICMFGDHHPFVTDLLPANTANGSLTKAEQYMNRYKTPFVIWANYDIAEACDLDISVNYLGGLVMDTAGVPLSPFFAFLQEQEKAYPIVTVNGYVDAAGTLYNWDGEDVFSSYRMLQYNFLYDDRNFKWAY